MTEEGIEIVERKIMYLCDGHVKGCRRTTCYRNIKRRDTSPVCFYTSHPENAVNLMAEGNGGYREMNDVTDDYWMTEKEAAELTAAIDEQLRKKASK